MIYIPDENEEGAKENDKDVITIEDEDAKDKKEKDKKDRKSREKKEEKLHVVEDGVPEEGEDFLF